MAPPARLKLGVAGLGRAFALMAPTFAADPRVALVAAADPRPEAIITRLAGRYVQYGHTTLRLVEKTERFRVSCVTRLDATVAARLGLRPLAGVQETLERWRADAHGDTVAVMPGPAVYPRAAA
jgi:hypothetical protein